MHISVGVVIKDRSDKILMIDRAAYPYGWACPAGHVDEDETPEQAAARESREEVNIEIKKLKLLHEEYVDWNECVKGIKGHYWYIYKAINWTGQEKRSQQETKNIGWFSAADAKKLKLEPVWEYWFQKLKI